MTARIGTADSEVHAGGVSESFGGVHVCGHVGVRVHVACLAGLRFAAILRVLECGDYFPDADRHDEHKRCEAD